MNGGKVVCVTGGSGYIASWLIKHLLLRGYTVKATVRDPSPFMHLSFFLGSGEDWPLTTCTFSEFATDDPKKTEHLLALDGAKERLHLFKANLLEEGSFDPIVEGCEGVFHTASPVMHIVTDPQTQLIEPAVKGTLTVLKSCAKVGSIKRVVLTSSMAAVVFNGKHLAGDVVVDETWYSDPDFCKQFKFWYPLSKVLAEKAACNFAKENGIDLVITNPAYVIGPLLQPTRNYSVEAIPSHVTAQTYPNAYFKSVDVRDVADAHILAFEVPSANGRYCLTANVTHFSDILKILRQHYPTWQLAQESEDGKTLFPEFQVSMEKAKSLGLNFTPFEVSLKDTIDSLKEKGLLATSSTSVELLNL